MMNSYKFADLYEGLSEEFSITITAEKMKEFLDITGDINPLHNDESFAKERGFGSKVVYGMLSASFISTLCGVYLPGKFCLIHSVETKFIKPVFVGDELHIKGVIKEIYDSVKQALIEVIITTNSQKVVKAKVKIGVLDE